MANPYSDDLRRRILEAYAQGEGTQQQLAGRFRVSVGYVEKIRGQQLTGLFDAPGRAHSLRGASPLHARQEKVLAERQGCRSRGGIRGKR